MFHTGHSVLGKTVGKRTEFKSNQSGSFPEAKQPCEFIGNRAPKEAIKHSAGCQGSASKTKHVLLACAEGLLPVPAECHLSPWGLWLGRQPGQQLVPIHPTWFISAGDLQKPPCKPPQSRRKTFSTVSFLLPHPSATPAKTQL